ncbi:CLCA_X family protein [Ferrimonas kyonanensis]|uniref:CLCA_X family protein n=1 Tax=Ferrimonas kyonanensis TaxID=364763 RepID=UPI0004028BDC|nr:CLCA_X family protein [Ferrimonas kyonanensis]
MTRPTPSSALSRDYYRRGPDYRFGDDVSFADIRDQFGLAGVRLGRWVNKQEQQLAANLVFDAMADLAYILNVPPVVIGLRGKLHLAFGTEGSRHSQAHYEPAAHTLALAKNAGAGALAHEYWHAFDHHIATKAFIPPTKASAFASNLWLLQQPMQPHPLNQRLSELFNAVFAPDHDDHGDFVERALALDDQLGRRYFSLPTELMARAFEACIQAHPQVRNHYLVNGTQAGKLAGAGAYPSSAHRQQIQCRLHDYFSPLGKALYSQ